MAATTLKRSASKLLQCHPARSSQPQIHRIFQKDYRPISAPLVARSRPSPSSPRQTSALHTSAANRRAAPKSKDRGPKSEEDTQTDFTAMDILSNMPVPTTAIDACMDDGFALNSGLKITGAGVMLVGGEAFKWRPWTQRDESNAVDNNDNAGKKSLRSPPSAGRRLMNARGQLDVAADGGAWGALDLVWPKPDLLIVGTGATTVPLSARTRAAINALGVRIEVQDTRNAAAQFNLLATERGVQQVAAALVPIGWREGR